MEPVRSSRSKASHVQPAETRSGCVLERSNPFFCVLKFHFFGSGSVVAHRRKALVVSATRVIVSCPGYPIPMRCSPVFFPDSIHQANGAVMITASTPSAGGIASTRCSTVCQRIRGCARQHVSGRIIFHVLCTRTTRRETKKSTPQKPTLDPQWRGENCPLACGGRR